MSDEVLILQKGTIVKGYKLERLLGRGGFGSVWVVYKNKDLFALKIMLEDLKNQNVKAIRAEERYLRMITKLRSVFLVNYIESFKFSGYSFFVMEFCDKGDLRKLIEDMKKEGCEYAPYKRILTIFAQISIGLFILHKNKVIHRNIKPDNIFVDEDGIAKIGNFHCSAVLEYTRAKQNTKVGTKNFMSPEIESGERYSYPCDIYSFGACLYTFITFKPYIREVFFIKHPDFPKDLALLIKNMVAMDPERRPTIEQIVCWPRLRKYIEEMEHFMLPSSLVELYDKTPSGPSEMEEMEDISTTSMTPENRMRVRSNYVAQSMGEVFVKAGELVYILNRKEASTTGIASVLKEDRKPGTIPFTLLESAATASVVPAQSQQKNLASISASPLPPLSVSTPESASSPASSSASVSSAEMSTEGVLMLQKGSIIRGYKLEKMLGRGGFGSVWLVSKGCDMYALKAIPEDVKRADSIKAVRAEESYMNLTANSNSVFLVKYEESFKQYGYAFFVMEYCDRGDLTTSIRNMKRELYECPSSKKVLVTFAQIAIGLFILHESKFIHRDLKPENIFVDEDGIAKIGDFGTAAVLENAQDLKNTIVGTKYFTAPEVEKGQYSYPCDIYSFGACMYNLITFTPYMGGPITTIKHPELPKDLLLGLKSMLAFNPADRPTIQQVICSPRLRAHIASMNRALLPIALLRLYEKTPIIETPSPSHHDKTPIIETSSPSHHDKTPIIETPSPSHHDKTPIIETPFPSHHDKTPITETPSPSHHDKTPVIETPSPSHHTPAPMSVPSCVCTGVVGGVTCSSACVASIAAVLGMVAANRMSVKTTCEVQKDGPATTTATTIATTTVTPIVATTSTKATVSVQAGECVYVLNRGQAALTGVASVITVEGAHGVVPYDVLETVAAEPDELTSFIELCATANPAPSYSPADFRREFEAVVGRKASIAENNLFLRARMKKETTGQDNSSIQQQQQQQQQHTSTSPDAANAVNTGMFAKTTATATATPTAGVTVTTSASRPSISRPPLRLPAFTSLLLPSSFSSSSSFSSPSTSSLSPSSTSSSSSPSHSSLTSSSSSSALDGKVFE